MRRLAVIVVACVSLVGACSSTNNDNASTGTAPGGTSTATNATGAPSGTGAPVAATEAGWVVHDAPAPCECSDGSPFQYLTRTVDPTKIVFYFEGGGACFSAETCRFTGGTYKTTAMADRVVAGTDAAGVFDFANPENPLSGWSWVYVPYCTGDVHIGTASHTYSDTLTVQHKGFVNGSAALDHLVAEFPDAKEVLVTGSSAGGVPSPLFGGLVKDRLGAAKVTVLADASGAYPDNPPVNAAIGGLWGTQGAVPPWPAAQGLAPDQFSIPGLFTLAGTQHPDVRMARFDNAYDKVQKSFSSLAAVGGGDQKAVILANEDQIEQAGVPIESYLAPGDDHTILPRKDFYTLETNGVRFIDWFRRYLAGEQVGDVHCTDCAPPPG